MDEIESKVVMPGRAEPLHHYARAYAYGPNNAVVAAYFIPSAESDNRWCNRARAEGAEDGQLALFCSPPVGMVSGERRWFKHLPFETDGGCSWIEIEFDLTTRVIEYAVCHGEV